LPTGDGPGPDATVFVRAGDNLREAAALEDYRKRCLAVLRAQRGGRLLLDLDQVTDADTKLVGLLLLIAARAQQEQTTLRLRLSAVVRAWIEVCNAGRYLAPRAEIEPGCDGPAATMAAREEPAP